MRLPSSITRTSVPFTISVRENGLDFLVMELLDGETLAARLARGPLSLEHAIAVAQQIASALDRAHRAGIVHRDLKPANVVVLRGSGRPTVKLLDFGLAKVSAAEVVRSTVRPRRGDPRLDRPCGDVAVPVDAARNSGCTAAAGATCGLDGPGNRTREYSRRIGGDLT